MDRVLVVEDNDLDYRLCRDLLETVGYGVVRSHGGYGSLDLARSISPVLIVLDMRLPDVSGPELATALKADAALRAIPILAVTAQAMKGDRERILAAGCDDYLSKPVPPGDLIAAVGRLIAKTKAKAKPETERGAMRAAEDGKRDASRTVLVIEDNHLNMRLFVDLLTRDGYRVLEAVNGTAALDILGREDGIDVVLTDIHLPDMTGLDVTRAIRADTRISHLPVVAATASVGPGEEATVGAAGCDMCLSKPFSIPHFLGVIRGLAQREG